MPTFLFELLLEDLPARVLRPAMEQLRSGVEKVLAEARLSHERIESFGTNRRLGLLVHGLQEKQEIYEEELTGPPAKTAFGPDGKPTQAAIKFAEGKGAKAADIYRAATPKGEYAAVKVKRGGGTAAAILAEALPRILGRMEFPVTMRWSGEDGGEHRFVRIVHGMVALMGSEPVPFSFAGVRSGRCTRGNRFLAGDREVTISSAEAYLDLMLKNQVLAPVELRRAHIANALEARARAAGGEFVRDDSLLDTVTAQAECPEPLLGSFEEKFLSIPREVLVSSMREHQKYFAVENRDGKLMPHFLTVAEVPPESAGPILANHAKVLRARLQDAAFFYETDRKQHLEARLERLKSVVFHEKLGSYYDKAMRLERLAPHLAEVAGMPQIKQDIARAARLCKCDLMSAMVYEFPTLQGVVGGIYAREEGMPENVWRAIYEHYRPEGLDGEPPASAAGKILSLADKMDTLAGFFAAGLKPSGSKDPFALRRAGNGIVALLTMEGAPGLPLGSLTHAAAEVHGMRESAREELEAFLLERFESAGAERGFTVNQMRSVLGAGWPAGTGVSLPDAEARLRALHGLGDSEDLAALAVAFKRARNILRDAKDTVPDKADPALCKERSEDALLKVVRKMDGHVQEDMKKQDYATAFRRLASMRLSVDQFFNDVMVMHEAEALRRNRLAILAELQRLFLRLADISALAISTKEN